MLFALAIATLVLAQQLSCAQGGRPTSVKPAAPKPPLHRFILTRYPADASVAFDTQTGQICKTWEWQPVGKSPARILLLAAHPND